MVTFNFAGTERRKTEKISVRCTIWQEAGRGFGPMELPVWRRAGLGQDFLE